MAKVTINENTLKQIVAESVKKVLSEIGDTKRGQYMLGRLARRQFIDKDYDDYANTHFYANDQAHKKYPHQLTSNDPNFEPYLGMRDAYDKGRESYVFDKLHPQLGIAQKELDSLK